jgi:hypothetical protein
VYVDWDRFLPPRDQLEALVASLQIERREGLIEPVSDDRSIAMLELESRAVVLRGEILEQFVRAYLARFPLDDMPLDETELEDRLEVAFDERTQPMTRYLLQVSLRYGMSVSLAKLAEQRYRRGTPSFRKLQRHMLRAVAYPMRDLQLWRVDAEERVERNGKTSIACYRIGAGPALAAFEKYVYQPLRLRQMRAFAAKHLDKE